MCNGYRNRWWDIWRPDRVAAKRSAATRWISRNCQKAGEVTTWSPIAEPLEQFKTIYCNAHCEVLSSLFICLQWRCSGLNMIRLQCWSLLLSFLLLNALVCWFLLLAKAELAGLECSARHPKRPCPTRILQGSIVSPGDRRSQKNKDLFANEYGVKETQNLTSKCVAR